ncbi:GntR family transcriptional regulator [Streptomyces sp. SL13]|uniref:GntR family transcriptional regulator n=1 Tax=Streptantibioticus silvisoli TaxID=2705255 RepID=A0AA90KHH7_9ACTN|nr:GntR family transcriptional regulator [Streptantibioticus silvisoli]MDI5971429.1 GntR family transcriptional regulator [Streptantibioticus silvisoli]
MAQANPRGTFRRVADAVRVAASDDLECLREADVVRDHGVSRTTARRALKALEADGFVRAEPGVGWRITGGTAPRSLPEQMVDLIREEQLAIGAPFPSEATLCERFQRSRPTIRRALAVLEADGFLMARPGKGRTVLRVPGTTEATPEAGADETD